MWDVEFYDEESDGLDLPFIWRIEAKNKSEAMINFKKKFVKEHGFSKFKKIRVVDINMSAI